MTRLYWYVLAVASIKPEASLTSFLAALRDARIEVVDYEEETRRVLHRVPFEKLPLAMSLWDKYTSSVTLEFKASGAARRVRVSLLRRTFAQVDETPSAILLLDKCEAHSDYSVFGELRGRRLTLKLCRREALEQNVTQLAPSLCVWIYPGVNPIHLMDAAQTCISSFYERFLKVAKGEHSA
ncbi:hypothetical protein Pyrfu_0965 [Pyrolobus fumarii 1A]|uniref:Uncharacterized protein n=1 Tax=Pyrolobus fumarii (strain DSM 11204 / 1A) TaxID=694429 RepID=G0EEL2_PYRF1|nr:hypothetical protein [Pyrolobus fumarii]AEM38834.1 hypothetical protein Pyrfu_0965 [Pyrolobus fumarii 1A]